MSSVRQVEEKRQTGMQNSAIGWRKEKVSVTEIEQALIDGLEAVKVRRGISAQIFLILEEDRQQVEMIQYVMDHRKATGEELLMVAREIAEK